MFVFVWMTKELTILKGIHPGFVLEKKLKDKQLGKGRFALSINEYPQTLTAITKGKRNMNTFLALKIEEALGLEEGYFMTLQVFFDIKQEKQKRDNQKPDLSKLRRVIFWDTSMEKINWQKQYRAVIQRVFERGNEKEKMATLYWNAVNDLLKRAPVIAMTSTELSTFRLVGGTSFSLQLGHRLSVDIDLFTDAPYASIDFQAIDRFFKTKFAYTSTNTGQVGMDTSYFLGNSDGTFKRKTLELIKLDFFNWLRVSI